MTLRIPKCGWLLMVIVVVGGLSSCRNDIDLNNIDTRMQADMGIALPVGSMLFTTNDFLGGGQINKIAVDEFGVFHYLDSIDIPTKHYHQIDLSKYVGKTDKVFSVKSEMARNGYIDASGWVKPDKKGSPIVLRFPLTVKLDGINSDLSDERIDSVQVTNATFTSLVNTSNLNLPWEWINSVDVVLNHQFRRTSGQTVRLYTKGDGYNYNVNIPITVDRFTLSLMKDKSATPGASNVVDTCGFTFVFNFTVPTSQDVQITDASAFDYHFETQFINFDAAWGFFEASSDMRDRDIVCIDSLWSDWKNIKKMKLRLMEPSVSVHASHHVAAPLMVYLDTLMVSNATEKAQATWNGNPHTQFILDNVVSPYGNLNDSAWNSQLFNYDADKGHLDNLFQLRPDSLLYSFRLFVDPYTHPNYPWKQHRVTSNTELHGFAAFDIPFKVDKESEIEYVTKISDVHFDKINLDSLLKSVKVIEEGRAKHIKLYLQLSNSLPFKVDAKVWFLRQDSSEMNLHLFEGQNENEITLSAPKMQRHAGEKYGYVSEPSVTTFIVDVEEQQFDSLVQCKHLKLDAYMGNNIEPCAIDTTNSIKVHLGVAADVQAIINLNKKDN